MGGMKNGGQLFVLVVVVGYLSKVFIYLGPPPRPPLKN